ncbi:MAG: hypothetical protein WD294_11140 [Phycisphaeraceae bacterium]
MTARERLAIAAIACAAIAVAGAEAPADVMQVNDREEIAANDSYDWSVLGVPDTVAGTNFDIDSVNGLTANVMTPLNSLVVQQPTNWAGGFADDDFGLFTGGGDTLTLDFAMPVQAVGAHIFTDLAGPFTATLTAFDADGEELGMADVTGTAVARPNEAPFLGLTSDAFDISEVVFEADNISSNDDGFAINEVSVNVIPAPATGTAALVMLGAIAAQRRRTRA